MTAPNRFKSAGEVVRAHVSRHPPPFIRIKRYTGRRADGVRYEKKVQKYLTELFPEAYIPSPWLRFMSGDTWRWCQPDGILVDIENGRIICVEVKYSHTADAWWQVEHLYIPVLMKCFPPSMWVFERCEIVRWYDPAVDFPEPVELAAEIDRPSSHFKVHICRL